MDSRVRDLHETSMFDMKRLAPIRGFLRGMINDPAVERVANRTFTVVIATCVMIGRYRAGTDIRSK
jgi:hypothetical protein